MINIKFIIAMICFTVALWAVALWGDNVSSVIHTHLVSSAHRGHLSVECGQNQPVSWRVMDILSLPVNQMIGDQH